MRLFNKINPLFFFLAFAVGLLWCYVSTPPPHVVVRFPSPTNAGQVLYKDAEANCYAYKAEKTACTADAKDQPISVAAS